MNTQKQINSKSSLRILPKGEEKKEAKKVSVDDGFTAIPNALLDAILDADLSKNQIKVVLGLIRKTLSWHKDMDWICNEQLAELCRICDRFEASRIKHQLIKMNVIVQSGRKIGLNLVVSHWASQGCRNSQHCGKHTTENVKSHNQGCRNSQPQKETITKEKINNTPLPPEGERAGEVSQEIQAQAKSLLDYYNELSQGACRDAKPFITLLTKTTNREAYSPDDIKLVIRWVLNVWSRRSGRPAKPANICRVNRFDGYLSDAVAWERSRNLVDCAEVVDAYNEALADRLGEFELDDAAEKQILTLLEHLKEKSVEGFRAYFQAFADAARPYYFGKNASGWKADFGFLMKPETLVNTRRGAIGGGVE